MTLQTVPYLIRRRLTALGSETDGSARLELISDICGITQEANLTVSRQRRLDLATLTELEASFAEAVVQIRSFADQFPDAEAKTVRRFVSNIDDRIKTDLKEAKARSI